MAALGHGLPVVVPIAADRPENAARCLVVRASGRPDQGDGVRRTSVDLLTAGPAGWEVFARPVAYTPRDPTRTWDQPARRPT